MNFWATWCHPCVEELPYFEQLNSEKNELKVVLVSLDFKSQYEVDLLLFLAKKVIKFKMFLLQIKIMIAACH
ncbi:TlpA disulfide reductase family protein [Flavobacterium sp. MAHUQ-51]|uniref:TlpA disulfide reductase family protein n=1 Tax=Flavobacterium sp. GCM10022190 TaxID=3252639 RepID=UPI00361A25B6